MKRRVVVTGLGAVTPIGIGLETLWSSIQQCVSGVDTITAFDPAEFPVRIAGEVRDFDPDRYFSPKEARHLDRFCQFAIAAA
ncbi:MAG: beta-ketoacyl-[acyl-carrier-protein] synthase II, partial [Planctomycetes bacterium]|nr:beta-ketoacyl-[acyl-carrier-protein] synthase II [Planctomycetota bacterium]